MTARWIHMWVNTMKRAWQTQTQENTMRHIWIQVKDLAALAQRVQDCRSKTCLSDFALLTLEPWSLNLEWCKSSWMKISSFLGLQYLCWSDWMLVVVWGAADGILQAEKSCAAPPSSQPSSYLTCNAVCNLRWVQLCNFPCALSTSLYTGLYTVQGTVYNCTV